MKNLVITTGDWNGIGSEVTAKALCQITRPPKDVRLIYFRSREGLARDYQRIHKKHSIVTVLSLDEALEASREVQASALIEVLSDESPALWVEETALAARDKHVSCLVTAPLSKHEIKSAGLKDLGHTDILKRVCKSKHAFMGFIGREFNVVLATGHIPVEMVQRRLSKDTFDRALSAAHSLNNLVGSRKAVGVLGLNPHAGDGGLIGSFDHTLSTWIKRDRKATGPLVPDVAFTPELRHRFQTYLALYHDQGLIPFKAIHGFSSGVHLTLGLPLRRTSVDHGTAKDLYGKDKADFRSMQDALAWGLKLSRS